MASSAVAESPEPDLSNITAPEAAAQARESNQAVAVTAEYTKTTQVFANPDGTFTAEIASGPVQIPSEETANGWEDIDTTLADTGGIVEPEAAAAVIEFSDGGDAELASLATGTRQFGMDWTSTLPAPSLVGDTATYSDVLPGIDLTLQARPQGFEQNLVVAAPPTEPIVVQLPLELKGLSASVDADGQMVMTDSIGKRVIAADPARMWGAEIDPAIDEPTVQAYVDTRVVNTTTGPMLEIAPDPEFFTQPGLTYPVTVDPAPDLAVDKDTYVDSSQPGQFFRNDTLLKAGSPNGSTKTRSLLKFAGVTTLTGKHINTATMKLYETFAGSCTATITAVYELNNPIETDTTWNNQPGSGSKYAEATTSMGCTSGSEGWAHFNDGGANGKTMTDLVQNWADGSANNGIRVEAANETAIGAYKKFKSSEAGGNVPVLSVNYDSYPEVPQALSTNLDGDPVLHGTFSDPDGGSGSVIYTVTHSSGDLIALSESGASVSSGQDSPLLLDSEVFDLAIGETYTWTAVAYDGALASQPAAPQVFVLERLGIGPSAAVVGQSGLCTPSGTNWNWVTQYDNSGHSATYGYKTCIHIETLLSGHYQVAARTKFNCTRLNTNCAYLSNLYMEAKAQGSNDNGSSWTNFNAGASRNWTNFSVNRCIKNTAGYEIGDFGLLRDRGYVAITFKDGAQRNSGAIPSTAIQG